MQAIQVRPGEEVGEAMHSRGLDLSVCSEQCSSYLCLGLHSWTDMPAFEVEASGSAGPGQPEGREPPAEFRVCKMCGLELPLSKYPVDTRSGKPKGAQCCSCSASGESLQRVLRSRWKNLYRERYSLLKAKPEMLRSLIVNLAKDPTNKQKRSLKISAVDLQTEDLHATRTRRRRVRTPLTWESFNEWFQEPQHGGYTPEQNEARWQELLQQSATKRDRDGITAGVGGQLRLWVKTGEREESESESAELRRHVKRHTAKKPFKGDEPSEFLAGDTVLSEEGGMVMADQSAADALCTHIEKALGLVSDDASVAEKSTRGSVPSLATTAPSSSSGGNAAAAAAEPTSKAEAAANARWQRDKDFRIAEAKRSLQEDIEDISSGLQTALEVVTAVRLEVLKKKEKKGRRQPKKTSVQPL